MVSTHDIEVYRRDVKSHGQDLSREDREKLLRPYLPPAPEQAPPQKTTPRRNGVKTARRRRRKRIRPFLKSKLHGFLYFIIHLVFGIYIRLRQIYHAIIDRLFALLYYHHRTPELIQRDVKNLSMLPEHLSVILTLKAEEDGGLEALMDDVAELGAWCASAGIPLLSVYEKNGLFKPHLSNLHSVILHRISSYFPASPQSPHVRLHAPSYGSYPPALPTTLSPPPTNNPAHPPPKMLNILLLSATDGRSTLVDLTRTLAEMSQSHKLRPHDITQDLINAEVNAATSVSLNDLSPTPTTPPQSPPPISITGSMMEPDLLIIFGPYVRLDGYPPWQLRLTEIFCVGDKGGGSHGRSGARVEYQGFLRALWRFAGAEMRFGG